jgi:cell shape-determining protein MreC
MGWIEDFQNLLQGVPLSAVLRERIALAEQKYEATLRENEQLKQKVEFLERENAELRAQIPQAQEEIVLSDDDKHVLVYIFQT